MKGGFKIGSMSLDGVSDDVSDDVESSIGFELGAGYALKNENKILLGIAAMIEYYSFGINFSGSGEDYSYSGSHNFSLYGAGIDLLGGYYFTDHIGLFASAGFRYLMGTYEYSESGSDAQSYNVSSDVNSLQPEISLGLIYKF